MAEKKMTKAMAFAAAAEFMAESHPEVAAVLAKAAETASRKSEAPRKPTAVQVANEGVKAEVLVAMEPGVKYTCAEVGKLVGVESSQKMSALLNAMVKAGVLAKETGRKSLFYLPEVE